MWIVSLIVVIRLLRYSQGITLTANGTLIHSGEGVTLTCGTSGLIDVDFFFNSVKVGTCAIFPSLSCTFTSSVYNTTTNAAKTEFYVTVSKFVSTNCGTYKCKDAGSTDAAEVLVEHISSLTGYCGTCGKCDTSKHLVCNTDTCGCQQGYDKDSNDDGCMCSDCCCCKDKKKSDAACGTVLALCICVMIMLGVFGWKGYPPNQLKGKILLICAIILCIPALIGLVLSAICLSKECCSDSEECCKEKFVEQLDMRNMYRGCRYRWKCVMPSAIEGELCLLICLPFKAKNCFTADAIAGFVLSGISLVGTPLVVILIWQNTGKSAHLSKSLSQKYLTDGQNQDSDDGTGSSPQYRLASKHGKPDTSVVSDEKVILNMKTTSAVVEDG